MHDLFPPQFAESQLNTIRQVLASGQGMVAEVPTQVLGQSRWFRTTIQPIRDAAGQVYMALINSIDITDRKATEQVLETRVKQATAELEDLYNNAPCGYHSLGPDGTFLRINDTELKWFGYTREELVGKKRFTDLVTPDTLSVFERNFPEFKKRGWVKDLEFTIVRKDGTHFPIIVDAIAAYDADGNYVLSRSSVFDNAARKQAELTLLASRDRLNAANLELARAARMKDEFLANMSHELRTPLNAVLGLSEGLLEEIAGPLTDKQKKAVSTIESSGHHLLTLINDVLDLSKIEAGAVELTITSVDVKQVCESSLLFIKEMAHKKKIQVELQCDPVVAEIDADERRLKQMLVNLLNNAVKFTPEGGRVGLEVSGDAEAGVARFSVWDTGIGIAPDQMARLFKPFVQLDSSLSRRYEGTGLGLALVARMTEMHGGSVAVESEPGKGSRFTIALPWGSALMTGPASKVTQLPKHLSSHLAEQRALVVEDSPVAAETLVRYLNELGMQATILPQGEGVTRFAASTQVDIILLDVLLPGESGWEVLKELKAEPRTAKIPVMMISIVDERRRGLELGAADYFVKPISREQLRGALLNALDSEPINRVALVAPVPTDFNADQHAPLILLAEDNDANALTISDYLHAKGYRVTTAQHGGEALEKAHTERPTLILMDIQMPIMDGLEATRQLRQDPNPEVAKIPIIALTALAMSGDRERCLMAGANEYMTKPVNLKQLVATIKTLLGG